MTKEEFAKARLLPKFSADAVTCLANGVLVDTTKFKVNAPPPSTWDWSAQAKPVVSPIQNQQQCGSCWAFSTTFAVEGINKLNTGDLVSLSEQQLVSCDKTNSGCNGGLQTDAIDYLVSVLRVRRQ